MHINVTSQAQFVRVASLLPGSVFTTTDPLTTYIVLRDVHHGTVSVFNFNRGRTAELCASEMVTPAKITAMNVTQVTA